jgi:hypothetical protein
MKKIINKGGTDKKKGGDNSSIVYNVIGGGIGILLCGFILYYIINWTQQHDNPKEETDTYPANAFTEEDEDYRDPHLGGYFKNNKNIFLCGSLLFYIIFINKKK